MLDTVGEFLKTTFADTLKRPLQPAGIAVAAVFLLLNSLFILPTLLDAEFPPADLLRDTDPISQVVIVAGLLLILAYVLASLTGSIRTLISEAGPGNSGPVYGYLIESQRWRLEKLKDGVRSDADTVKKLRERKRDELRLLTDFPDEDTELKPTSLGNVLASTTSYVRTRYGIDLTALWPEMEVAILKEEHLHARLKDEKATLDFLVNLTFSLLVFTVEYAVVHYAFGGWEVIVTPVFLLLALVTYQAAIDQARNWGTTVQLTFDLHRDELRQRLGLRPTTGLDDERLLWRRVSRWVRYGEQPSDVFAYTQASSPILGKVLTSRPTATASPNAVANLHHAVQQEWRPAYVEAGEREQDWVQSIHYTLMVSAANPTSDKPVQGIQVVVRDPRLKLGATDGKLVRRTERTRAWCRELIPSDEADCPHNLLWELKDLPGNGSTVLQYNVVRRRTKFRTSGDIEIDDDHSKLEYETDTALIASIWELQLKGIDNDRPESWSLVVQSDDFQSEGVSLVCVAFDDLGILGVCEVQAGSCNRLLYGQFKLEWGRNIVNRTEGVLMLRLAVLRPVAAKNLLPNGLHRIPTKLLQCSCDTNIQTMQGLCGRSAFEPAVRVPALTQLCQSPTHLMDGTVTQGKSPKGGSVQPCLHNAAYDLLKLEHLCKDYKRKLGDTAPPQSAALLNDLGCAWARLEDWNRAEEAFRSAINCRERKYWAVDKQELRAKRMADHNLQLIWGIREA